MASRASKRPYNSLPLLNNGVSGEFRYFGSPQIEHAPAKADHVALHIADGEHDAFAKAVVPARLALVVAFLTDNHQTRFHQIVVLVVGEHRFQALPSVRRIAEPEAQRDLAREPRFFRYSIALGAPRNCLR